MATITPRIHITTDAETRSLLEKLAKRDATSLASKAEEYLKIGLELAEDVELAALAVGRMKTARSKYLSHDEVWG
jgi:predicted DNA-binding protein